MHIHLRNNTVLSAAAELSTRTILPFIPWLIDIYLRVHTNSPLFILFPVSPKVVKLRNAELLNKFL